jgi:hypothetical protein
MTERVDPIRVRDAFVVDSRELVDRLEQLQPGVTDPMP